MKQNITISESAVHSYHPAVAEEVGINAAVLFYNICFCVAQNTANERNCVNGKYWTYNSVSAYSRLFPEFSEKQVRTALKKLEDCGYIESGCFNEDPYDHTKWYTVTNGAIRFVPIGKIAMTNMAEDNNIYNNKNTISDNKQEADDKQSDNSHKEDKTSKDAQGKTFSSERRDKPKSTKQKYLDKKEEEIDMLRRIRDICDSNYDKDTANEICFTLNYYFEKYTKKTGLIHPILRDDTLKHIIDRMSYYEDTEYGHFERVVDEPGEFCKLVDEFFNTDFGQRTGERTNWNLSHFMSYGVLDKIAQRVIEY